jgi:phosphoglycolate phosphatase
LKAIIFDLDGTLVDSAPDIHAATEKMLQEIGQPVLSLETVTSFIGNGVPKLVERVIAARGLGTRFDADDLLARFMRHYAAAATEKTRLYPHVAEALQMLGDDGYALGLCTNKPKAPTALVLEAFDLARFFDVVVCGDTLPVKKPDPAPLQLAIERLGATGSVYVGDSEVDAATAKAAAIPFALFTEGYRKSDVSDIPKTYSFSDFAELGVVIDKVFVAQALPKP